MGLAFSQDENDKLRLQLLQSFCILLDNSVLIRMNQDILETEDSQTDLGKFMRNAHYLLVQLLKHNKLGV